MSAPLTYVYMDDGEMRALPHLVLQANQQFVVGERYRLEVADHRSDQEHDHYFATLNDIFSNLPETLDGRWIDMHHMRRWALCETGFCAETHYPAKSEAEAIRVALAFRTTFDWMRRFDNEVVFRKAFSQSYRSMGKREFQRSKAAVLEHLAGYIGVDVATLTSNAGRAA